MSEPGTVEWEARRAERAEQRAEAAEARVAELTAKVGELEAALKKSRGFVETLQGMVPTQSAHDNIARFVKEIDQALAASPTPVGEAERAVVEAAMVFLSTRTSADLENLRMKGDALAKVRKAGGE